MPKTIYRKLVFNHLGTVYSNISITATIITVFMLLSSILTALLAVAYFLIALVLVVGTLGIMLLLQPKIFEPIAGDTVANIVNFAMGTIAPVSTVVALVSAVLAVLFLCLGEPKKHKGRLVFSCIVSAVALLLTVVVVASKIGGTNG